MEPCKMDELEALALEFLTYRRKQKTSSPSMPSKIKRGCVPYKQAGINRRPQLMSSRRMAAFSRRMPHRAAASSHETTQMREASSPCEVSSSCQASLPCGTPPSGYAAMSCDTPSIQDVSSPCDDSSSCYAATQHKGSLTYENPYLDENVSSCEATPMFISPDAIAAAMPSLSDIGKGWPHYKTALPNATPCNSSPLHNNQPSTTIQEMPVENHILLRLEPMVSSMIERFGYPTNKQETLQLVNQIIAKAMSWPEVSEAMRTRETSAWGRASLLQTIVELMILRQIP